MAKVCMDINTTHMNLFDTAYSSIHGNKDTEARPIDTSQGVQNPSEKLLNSQEHSRRIRAQMASSSPLFVPWVKGFSDKYSWGESQSQVQDLAVSTMETAINSAIYATDTQSQFGFEPICPTESCAFADFESLGFCSSCEDVTSTTKLEDCNFNFTLEDFRALSVQEAATSAVLNTSCKAVFEMSRYHDRVYHGFEHVFDVNITLLLQNKEYYDSKKDPLGIGDGGWNIWQPSIITYPSQITWIVNRAKVWALDGPREYFDFDSFPEDKDGLKSRNGDQTRWNSVFNDTEAALLSVGNVTLGYNEEVEKLAIQHATVCSIKSCVQRHSISVNNLTTSSKVVATRMGSFYINPGYVYSWLENTKPLETITSVNSSILNSVNLTSFFRYDLANNEGRELGGGPGEGVSTDPVQIAIDRAICGESTSSDQLEPTYFAVTGDSANLTSFLDDGRLCKIRPTSNQTNIVETTEVSISNLKVANEQGGLEWLMPKIAEALSRSMRDRSNLTVTGQVGIIALGSVFLLATVWLTRAPDQYLWKSSSLPLFFHGLETQSAEGMKDQEALDSGVPTAHMSAMEKMVKRTRASLATDGETVTPSNSNRAAHPLPRSSTSRSSRSYGSYDTGESSTAASLIHDPSTATTNLAHPRRYNASERSPSPSSLEHGNGDLNQAVHRRRPSHKPRSSGGFLLPNAIADESPKSGPASRDGGRRHSRIPVGNRKGKSPLNTSDRSGATEPTHEGLGTDARDVVASSRGQRPARHTANHHDERRQSQGPRPASRIPSPQPAAAPFDMDSTQIVNMALNLSESRRLASRRNISTPIPPRLSPVADNAAGGSLRQHLQQQRRSSRNISPRPGSGLAPRNVSTPMTSSPLHPTFEHEGSYTYHFSSSTLNRAQKAKEHLELMAQYRRLLQFVPPLKQDTRSRPSTSSPPTSPTAAGPPANMLPSPQPRTLGRPYNPLQYVRNRKIRNRERKTIDGEAQGFADTSRVTDWIDEAATLAATSALMKEPSGLPPFPGAQEHYNEQLSASNIPRPTSATGKGKRPRIDWVLDPADMLADAYWLEQGDNRHLVEDRHYAKIFPRNPEAYMPSSRQADKQGTFAPFGRASKEEDRNTSTGLELEDSTPARADTETSTISAKDRARQKLQDLRGMHHRHGSSVHSHDNFLRFRRGSLSDTSDSEGDRKRRGRGGTVSANSQDLLEKQMLELLAKEAREEQKGSRTGPDGGYFKPFPAGLTTPERSTKTPKRELSPKGTRLEGADYQDKTPVGRVPVGRVLQESPIASGRQSLEVPPHIYRASMDLDSSRPVSPDSKPMRRRTTHMPAIGMDLSPSGSRPGSPVRNNPFSKVKRVFRDRSRERGDHGPHEKEEKMDSPVEQMEPLNISTMTKEGFQFPVRRRSKSPIPRIIPRTTNDTQKSHRSMGSLILKGDEQTGLKSIFKGGTKLDGMIRGSVSKVSDFIWKKDSELDPACSSSTSSDESDVEQKRGRLGDSISLSRSSSKRPRDGRNAKNYLDIMPAFESANDSLDKSISHEADIDQLYHSATQPPSRSARFDQLKPPRIDIRRASPSESELEQVRNQQAHDSDSSDTDSPPPDSGGYTARPRQTSQELNNILTIPAARAQKARTRGNSTSQPPKGRHWSITDRNESPRRAPISKRELGRLRTLILCSGIKAMEISRRANEPHPLFALDNKTMGLPWTDTSRFASDEQVSLSLPQTQLFPATAHILSDGVDRSVENFEASKAEFLTETAPTLQSKIDHFHGRIATDLVDMTRRAVDEADEVSRDVVDTQRLKVKSVLDTMDKMLRGRRRRFRWVRRAGWLAVEWVLVGFMWYVWFVVMITRIFLGVGKGVVNVVRWLLWL
ncbi:Uu.00g027720.m01.CDS01 [Anthostomella pinea]|uniref:Uu.00g027720.m01.CDS01 n=1 Tax=Anthostomella pinea TaxID=933095 RepID=A0AAI8YAB3_9PEZI|nr:Uu.00g027720.m01.CDS01 [Anthostomella pinea]